MRACHSFVEPANTTDAVRHACGTCGGDKRQPRAAAHQCQSVVWDGGEYVPCRRTDTRHHGVGVYLCPEHANTHRRLG